MKKLTPTERSTLSGMKAKLKSLQADLVEAKKREGIDDYLSARIAGTKTRFTRTKIESGPDRAVGEFRIILELTTKRAPVSIPLSIASGKTVAGFMYQIEGTGESSIASASVSIRTRGLTETSIGTLRYVTLPAGKKNELELTVTVRGKVGRQYQIVLNRINYKLTPADPRYQQYLKSLTSKPLKFA
jgi:hypothetical protein